MGLGTAFRPERGRALETRVGRRVVLLFIVCAVLPAATLGIASYITIRNSLREQALERGRLTAKRIGAALLERLVDLDSTLSSVAARVSKNPALTGEAAVTDHRFSALVVMTDSSHRALLGALPAVPRLDARQRQHIQSGRTVVTTTGEARKAILMGRQVEVDGGQGMIWAQVSGSVVDRAFAAEAGGITRASSCIVLADGSVVRCAGQDALRRGAFAPALTSELSGAFAWEGEQRYLAGFWSLFLGAEFAAPDWRITVSQPEAEVLASLSRFRRTFALSALLATLIVALLSTIQIRRSFAPLAELRAGTERIGRLEFNQAVEVKSGDEFEGLADAFNAMSDRVRKQFMEARGLNEALAGKSEQLEEREIRLAAILDASADAIVTVDAKSNIESFNRTAERIFGVPAGAAIGRSLNDLFAVPLASGAGSLDAGAERGGQTLEVAARRNDGAIFPAEVRFTEARTGDRMLQTVFIRDISERKRAAEEQERLEAQLRHAHKLETIGTLAGGIAHDFNNILTPIIGNVGLALEEPVSADVKESLQQVLAAAMRAKDLVSQILLFSRRGEARFSPIDVGPIAREALKLVRASLPATIGITSNITSEPAWVVGDPTQLHQLLMNLSTNAYHAMPDGGVLEVRLDLTDVEPPPGGRDGEQRVVRLVVRDTGKGMDAATVERMFEPFFTTKPAGQGTGLGMSIVHGIVTHHGGTISVESTPGAGTTFEIHLPRVATQTEVKEGVEGLRALRGEGRILVVDDDVVITEFLARVLTRAGYDVVPTTAPSEVPAMLANAEQPFDLIITDLTMPAMTGLQLADRIKSWRRGFPIILLSGYSELGPHQDLQKHGLREVLTKPVTIDVLTATVARVLREERLAAADGSSRTEAQNV